MSRIAKAVEKADNWLKEKYQQWNSIPKAKIDKWTYIFIFIALFVGFIYLFKIELKFGKSGVYTVAYNLEIEQKSKQSINYKFSYMTLDGKEFVGRTFSNRIVMPTLDTSKYVLMLYLEEDPNETMVILERQFSDSSEFRDILYTQPRGREWKFGGLKFLPD